MKASDLIARLRELIEEHGDLDVTDPQDEEITIAYNEADPEGTYDEAFVVE